MQARPSGGPRYNRPNGPPPYAYGPPPPPPHRWHFTQTEWGLNLRLNSALISRQRDDSGMGGVGMSLRYRPNPVYALDIGLDVIGGTDWSGKQRSEVPFSVSGLAYLSQTGTVHPYLVGGFAWSRADVSPGPTALLGGTGGTQTYRYFGAHVGGGLEFRLTRSFAIDLDMILFLRGRTDKTPGPEFVDELGRTTNTSGGGLLRAGTTFWW